MAWDSASPDGSLSVKDNRTQMNANNEYISATMGDVTHNTKDHFWDISGDKDGYHRSVNMPAQVGHISPATVAMDGVIYYKSAGGTVQAFFKNNTLDTYQFIPSFKQGTVVVNASYGNVINVPASVYGEIFMYTTALGKRSAVTGFFRSNATIVESWGLTQSDDGTQTSTPLKFASDTDATTLFIKARTSDASNGQTWNYRITYRAT